jgi:cell division transport system permease protein
VEYLTKEQAYERYKRLFSANQGLISIADPKYLPASFVVTLKHPERYAVIQQGFSGSPGVDEVSSQNVILDRIFNLFSKVRIAALLIALIQLFAALLLISNTIQISAFTRRTEVGIMRLVGATRWYTQMPFLIEAVITGVVGAVLATAGLVAGKLLFIDRLLSGRLISNAIPPIGMSDVVLYVAPLLVVVGAAIATATGYVTLRLYVRQ